MAIQPSNPPTETPDPPVVVLGEVIPRPLEHPPAIPESFVLTTCRCGNVTDRGHGAIGGRRPFTCAEVLEIRARVDGDTARGRRLARLARILRGGTR